MRVEPFPDEQGASSLQCMDATNVALVAATLSLIAATLSALISARTALNVARRQHDLQRSRNAEDASIARMVEFLSASQAVSLAISEYARTPRDDRASMEELLRSAWGDRYSSALAAIRIAEPDEVAAAANDLNEHLIGLLDEAVTRQWSRREWWDEHSSHEAVVERFVLAAQRAVGQFRPQ